MSATITHINKQSLNQFSYFRLMGGQLLALKIKQQQQQKGKKEKEHLHSLMSDINSQKDTLLVLVVDLSNLKQKV